MKIIAKIARKMADFCTFSKTKNEAKLMFALASLVILLCSVSLACSVFVFLKAGTELSPTAFLTVVIIISVIIIIFSLLGAGLFPIAFLERRK